MQQVKIGRSFFANATRDYNDWRFAMVREYAQNSIDCKAKNIVVTITEQEKTTKLIWANDGPPMTREILCDKLLALGETGKNFEDAVGGFGRAKEVLLFCHLDWQIRTGHFTATGSGGSYTLTEHEECYNGSEFTITIEGKHATRLIDNAKKYIVYCQWKGTFTINGEVIEDRTNKGRRRKELSCGVVYTSRQHQNVVIVRVAGITMFTRYTSYKHAVILELTGSSLKVLQSNRDSLTWTYSEELDAFLVQLTVDKRSALKDNTIKIDRRSYTGYRLKGKTQDEPTPARPVSDPSPERIQNLMDDGLLPLVGTVSVVTAGGVSYDADSPHGRVAAALTNLVAASHPPISVAPVSDGAIQPLAPPIIKKPVIPMRPEFTLKNETGITTPSWYLPESFSVYSKTLVWRWMGCLVTLADLCGSTKPFSVGFILSEEREAEYEGTDSGPSIIFLNPAVISRTEGRAPVFRNRWSLNNDGIWRLVSTAIHEFIHYTGISYHDDGFAEKHDELTSLALRERTRFAKVFQTKVEWPDFTRDE